MVSQRRQILLEIQSAEVRQTFDSITDCLGVGTFQQPTQDILRHLALEHRQTLDSQQHLLERNSEKKKVLKRLETEVHKRQPYEL